MKKTLLVTGSAIAIAIAVTGCAAKSGNEVLANMDNKSVLENQIIDGKSGKEDVKRIMGADPQSTDFDQNGHEKWTYANVRKSAKAINYVPVANWFVSGTNDTTTSLIVLFDDKGTVFKHILSQSQGETKGGLFQ